MNVIDIIIQIVINILLEITIAIPRESTFLEYKIYWRNSFLGKIRASIYRQEKIKFQLKLSL